ncbi:MAG: RNA polymerase sporulation sigma factor SigH [Clostridia bacterium]|nr:RNA polymerase sporulation sigma factor SigH [Clostridia bacterium]
MTTYTTFSLDNSYENMTDEQLLEMAKKDKKALNCLLERYNNVVNMKANKFFMIGAEREDMVQEGMIGLYKAVKSFDLNKQNSFKTFANLCIERQLITAVKNSNRQKHIPLNSSVSLNASAYDENDDTTIMEVLETNTVDDPSDIIAQKEYYNYIETKIDESLSGFEKKVLDQYKQGKSYASIAETLDTKVKSVDTAIQRIRKKAIKIRDNIK